MFLFPRPVILQEPGELPNRQPALRNEQPRPGEQLLTPVRQLIESVSDTLKGQLDLEAHSGRTFEGVAARVAQRILAMATAIWHNHRTC